ncbi:hypothetical protein XENOCAPTIV_000879 [Xenoophorus captivus]|uniref:Uncharacterized protein n=1 Tax=Xenoophorus captivus TaxID=1517983 RepID=A0ABV0S6N9_9TELE
MLEDEDDFYKPQSQNQLSSAYKATSLSYAGRWAPWISEDKDQISTCPHCHLALPLPTLKWHELQLAASQRPLLLLRLGHFLVQEYSSTYALYFFKQASLADVGDELLDLSEELGLCCVMALLFARPVLAQSQPGLGQSQEMFVLFDGFSEILSDPLLAVDFRQDLEGTEALPCGQPVLSTYC